MVFLPNLSVMLKKQSSEYHLYAGLSRQIFSRGGYFFRMPFYPVIFSGGSWTKIRIYGLALV